MSKIKGTAQAGWISEMAPWPAVDFLMLAVHPTALNVPSGGAYTRIIRFLRLISCGTRSY